MKVRASKS